MYLCHQPRIQNTVVALVVTMLLFCWLNLVFFPNLKANQYRMRMPNNQPNSRDEANLLMEALKIQQIITQQLHKNKVTVGP